MSLRDIDAAAYHADELGETRPSLSSSLAHLLLERSPAHARLAHPWLNDAPVDQEPEDRFDLGTAAHALLLQGTSVVHVVDAKDWRTKEAREQRDEARAHGMIPMLPAPWDRCRAMVAACYRQLAAIDEQPPMFTDGKAEQVIVWEDEGVLCRAMIDWLRDDRAAIDDYKTTGASAAPDAWSRNQFFAIGCDIQVAFYLRGCRQALGVEPRWRYVVQETSPPYAVQVFTPGPDVLAVAEAKVEYAIRTWGECLRRDEWPGYPQRVATVEMPGWIETRWLEREIRDAA